MLLPVVPFTLDYYPPSETSDISHYPCVKSFFGGVYATETKTCARQLASSFDNGGLRIVLARQIPRSLWKVLPAQIPKDQALMGCSNCSSVLMLSTLASKTE